MARVCRACKHPRRTEIDSALVSGAPLRTIADRFSVSKTSLIRHKAHLAEALGKAKADQADQADHQAAGLAGKLDQLEGEATALGLEARVKGDLKVALASVGERSRLLALRVTAHVKGIPGAGVSPPNRFKAIPAPGHPALPLPVAGITVLPTPEARQRLREAARRFLAWRQELPEADRPAFALTVLARCKARLAEFAANGAGNGTEPDEPGDQAG